MWSLIQPVGNPNGRFDCDVAIGYPDVGRQRGGARRKQKRRKLNRSPYFCFVSCHSRCSNNSHDNHNYYYHNYYYYLHVLDTERDPQGTVTVMVWKQI